MANKNLPSCPLLAPKPYIGETDKNGVIWNGGIPESCKVCIASAFHKHVSMVTEYFDPIPYDGEELDSVDSYVAVGISRLSNEKRILVEEVGISDNGDNEGFVVSSTTVIFDCLDT